MFDNIPVAEQEGPLDPRHIGALGRYLEFQRRPEPVRDAHVLTDNEWHVNERLASTAWA